MWKELLTAAVLVHAGYDAWGASAGVDSFPSKPIRIIDGFAPGGGTDYMARVMGPKLVERFGQPVIVDNRPGAAGTVGTDITARANPDGYTLSIVTSTTFASTFTLYSKVGSPVLKDFSYISRVATGAQILVAHPSLPAKTVSDLVMLARSKPKAIRYGSAGVGSTPHLTMELLQSVAGIEFLHIPYKGSGPAVIALTGAEVQIVFAGVSAAMPMIQAKRLNALAVASGKRLGALPEIPTVAESGVPGYDVTNSYGILAPSRTPAAVVRLLNTEFRNIVQMDDVRAKFAAQGLDASGSTPEEFRAVIEAEVAQWARVIKDANITAN